MNKVLTITGIMTFFVLILFSWSFAQEETFTITTYYPSPYGSYNELQTNKMAVGDTNADGDLDSDDQPANDGDLLVAGNVGIGILSPSAKLHVAGRIRITGGSPGANKVLTSDANGLASWQTPAAPAVVAIPTGLYGTCFKDAPPGCSPQCGGVRSPAYTTAAWGFCNCACPSGYTLVTTGHDPAGPTWYSCYKN